MDYSYDYLFKIIVIGDKRVGKSSLIKRFRENAFEEGSLPPTIGIDFHVKDLEIGDSKVKVRKTGLTNILLWQFACFKRSITVFNV